ncbi:hypothetical protein [Actinoplanes teichomyceticus]|uniref:Uncharacterized protein n=1 Tax=Actinoplanes teichomyceticus TaxID=1867 RepID=A0A561VLP1_ACTTI|nr:hypothetical protein [Actinoplanes teichomyceticus]TWG12536.1 hypothetical protein FHX34_105403 [Actinoplanes teichomyceticus]GIF13902.1 hypothetical protein Ate01nite_39340 [Actinoplanes teichomyceticus]
MLLADRPHRWARVPADRSLSASTVEEAPRFDAGPGRGLPRCTVEDIEVAGCPIRAASGHLELAVPAGRLRRRAGLIVGGIEEVPAQW